MSEKLNEIIREFLDGDKQKFLLIVQRMNPLICKYVRHLYRDEKEDMRSEFILSLLEAVNKLKYYEDEWACFTFLCNALKNRYLELYKKSKQRFINEVCTGADSDFEIMSGGKELYIYCEVEFRKDLMYYLSDYNDRQRKILLSLIIEGKSDSEAALLYHISRQYVNRLKRKLYKEIKIKYYEL